MILCIEVSESDFRDAFNRSSPGQFSYIGLGVLYDYYANLEKKIYGDSIELNVVGVCRVWEEYDNLEAVKAVHNDIKNLDDLKDKTKVIEVPPKLSFDVNGNKIYSGGGLLVREF